MAPDTRAFGTGWIPDKHDDNDKTLADLYGMQREGMQDVYQIMLEKAKKRTKVNLEGSCPPIYNQLALGSCVANAVAAALRFAWKNTILHISTPYKEFDPSRLWIYYYARQLGAPGRQFRDTGCEIRDALKVLKNKGACTEEDWPYLTPAESKVLDDRQDEMKDEDWMDTDCRAGIVPEKAEGENATKWFDFGFDYHRIRSLSDKDDAAAAADTVITQMCACLAEGFPIIFGFGMFLEAGRNIKAFYDKDKWIGVNKDVFNVTDMETLGAKKGGHAVLCVGFDETRQLFRIMNSWGPGNGSMGTGFFWMPFAWFKKKNFTYDLWTIRPHTAPLLRDHDPIEE